MMITGIDVVTGGMDPTGADPTGGMDPTGADPTVGADIPVMVSREPSL